MPLLSAALIIPAAMFAVESQKTESPLYSKTRSVLDAQVLELVLKRFAEYWGLGSFCLGEWNRVWSRRYLIYWPYH